VRKRIYTLGIIFGLLSVGAYWYTLENVGGFVAAYSKAKGGGHAESGYIGEAALLSFPAIMLLAIARSGLRIRIQDIALALLFAMPHLLQGTFGGRRGPIFLILCVLFLAWYTAKGKSPTLKEAVIGVGAVGVAVLLVWSQRQHLYLGAEEAEFQSSEFADRLLGEDLNEGNTFVAGAATIITADRFENFYWGYRYFVTFVVRPIPKQLWPTKYDDMGADWLYRYGDEEREIRYWEALGFRLPDGTAPGSIADGYLELSWGVVPLFFMIGLFYGYVWRRHRADGGFWTILLVVMLILSIYLATQSVTAWGHRLFYIGLTTFLVWKYWLGAPMKTRAPQLRYAPAPGPLPSRLRV
jgi:oligosaccharide repeat unit polymerase